MSLSTNIAAPGALSSHGNSSRWMPVLFAIAALALGMGVAAIGYALGTIPEAGMRRPPLYPADWMFWAIWFVLYPAMGVAGYHLWRHRRHSGSRLALRLYVMAFVANLTWVPVVHLARSPVAAPAIMDAIAGLLILPAFWAISKYNWPAFLWCLPLLVWGPVTGSLKIWQLLLNRQIFSDEVWPWIAWSIYVGAVTVIGQLTFLVRGFFTRKWAADESR